MATARAGRTAGASQARMPAHRALPLGRAMGPTTRRRAALNHGGHRLVDLPGVDGETTVRFEAAYQRAEPAAGERRLLLAVLEDGIRTLLKHAGATRGRALNLQREAFTWLTAGAQRDVFAFESICETLGIDPERLRQRVLTESSDSTAAAAN